MTRIECLQNIFHVLCIIAASSLITYWLYAFSLNEDLCNVYYKNYRENKADKFPILYIWTYIDFLKGKSFNSELLNIGYNDLKMIYLITLFQFLRVTQISQF